MKTLFLILVAVTMLAAGLLILIGETSDIWASYATINGEPTLEIQP